MTDLTYDDSIDSTPARRLQYDDAGNAILFREETDTDVWRETEFVYDYLDRLCEVTGDDPDGSGPLDAPVGSYEYDDDNLTAIEDPNHNLANFSYGAGLLDEAILPKAYSTDDEGRTPGDACQLQ